MSTSKLQRYTSDFLSRHLSKYTIRENIRPEWLEYNGERLELDFFIEEIRVAFEVQGDQHFKYVEFFHGDVEGFLAQTERDKAKAIMCKAQGIELIYIETESEARLAILNLVKSRSEWCLGDVQAEIVATRAEAEFYDRQIKTVGDYYHAIKWYLEAKSSKLKEKTVELSYIEKSLSAEDLSANDDEGTASTKSLYMLAKSLHRSGRVAYTPEEFLMLDKMQGRLRKLGIITPVQ